MKRKPDGKVRLGVVGLGRAFSLMLPTFLADDRIVLAAACDPRDTARRQFARDFGALVYEDLSEMAFSPDIDAVYIASPHQFHAAHACLAAANGKHLLVEKPMALSTAECDQMIEACARAEVQMIVGHCHSFDSPYLHTRRLLDSGRFGAVRMIHALNYTDFMYRPRRPEELQTEAGGGVVFSQAAHQVDVVRLLAGSPASRVRATLGQWDPTRPTEGAYSAMLWFENGSYASLTYSGYGRFNSDPWNGGFTEMGFSAHDEDYGKARRRLAGIGSAEAEARLKADATYGGPSWTPPASAQPPLANQHFGPVIVSCEHADIRPMSDGIWVYGDREREHIPLPAPAVPRFEVIDELIDAVVHGRRPVHDGPWAKATLAVCLAMLASAREARDIELPHQAWLV
ncbi:Gfo/Idh/MocA family protein [Cupriavidus basilensis]|uniref:Gfo/Idh/MocA family protein n=1 Tax=Cupriavidus basilensis TaxID=68895 RepID=UPI00157AC047|nr:Gfo/Idh/MocA family oxidoreductase [Cupriavidus basilensis]MCP3024524.1 Gfo/Idh/MocA family oxidoreductase [Cupriavidus basilensis]NUA27797.1 Gfo/Idh/MocA family oxidoreductase [Cupriavidus basilensis]